LYHSENEIARDKKEKVFTPTEKEQRNLQDEKKMKKYFTKNMHKNWRHRQYGIVDLDWTAKKKSGRMLSHRM